jgi:hypothetical protein
MTDNTTDIPEKSYDSYFGGCPQCGGTHGCMNIGRDHWFVCDDHKTKWLVGSNLFSSWREENEETWRQNAQRLADYVQVPIGPARDDLAGN